MQAKDITNILRKASASIILTALTGLGLVSILTIKFYNDMYTDGLEQFVMLLFVCIMVFRYTLLLRKQSAVMGETKLTESEQLETYYKRSFYFWLMEGILSLLFLAFLLYILMEEYY